MIMFLKFYKAFLFIFLAQDMLTFCENVTQNFILSAFKLRYFGIIRE